MDASAAVMILLMCPGGADCMEIRSDRTYETASVCREALPTVVARLTRNGRTVSGHRAPALDEARPELDPIVTCSTSNPGQPEMATVRVTRMMDGQAISDDWVVPREKPRGCS
jgi:hypothetical protein